MKNTLTTLLLLAVSLAFAQSETVEYAEKTFNSSLGLNYNTTETLDKGSLSFYLGHRFGKLNSGYQTFFGLDEFASWRLDFMYGISDHLSVGIARNSLDKLHDVYAKYQVVKQTKGNEVPLSITVLPRMGINGTEFTELEQQIYSARHRMNYAMSVLIGRKLTEKASVQLFPMVVHENLTEERKENNTSFALGGLFKYKFSRTGSVLAEYAHNLNYDSNADDTYHGTFAIGLGFTTYSHNFSVMLTNSVFMVENQTVPFNHGNFFRDDIRIGFNIARTFIL